MSDQSQSQPPGWYYAQGDPPGTNRFWDGTQWQGGPQAVGSVMQPTNPGDQTYGQAQYGAGQHFPEASQATIALVLSIVGLLVCCLPIGPIGWYLAQQELNGIDSGRRNPTNRGNANGAKVVGIIATVVMGLLYLFWLFSVALRV